MRLTELRSSIRLIWTILNLTQCKATLVESNHKNIKLKISITGLSITGLTLTPIYLKRRGSREDSHRQVPGRWGIELRPFLLGFSSAHDCATT